MKIHTIRRLVLWSIILSLVILPFVVRHLHSQRAASAIALLERELRDSIVREREEISTRVIHGDRVKDSVFSTSMATIPLPDDLFLFSAMTLSRDSARIAVAGGSGSEQKIYVADFPPKNKGDFRKITSLPGSVAITAMRWNDFDSNVIGLISIEAERSGDNARPITVSDPDRKDLRIVLYAVDVLTGEMKEIYVSDRKVSRRYVLAGANASKTSICWEQPDRILTFDGRMLNRIQKTGEIELVSEIDFPHSQSTILSARTGVLSILGASSFLERTPQGSSRRAIVGVRPHLIQVNLETKEVEIGALGDSIEAITLLFFNGDRLLGGWYSYGDKFRYIVREKNNPAERTIVETPRQGYKGAYLYEMSPDGRYGIAILSSAGLDTDAYRDAIVYGTRPSRDWDAIGIIPLP